MSKKNSQQDGLKTSSERKYEALEIKLCFDDLQWKDLLADDCETTNHFLGQSNFISNYPPTFFVETTT